MSGRALLLVAALLAGGAAVARAQTDDWSVTRSEFHPRVLNRWKAVLERNPSDTAALKKLIDLYGRHSSVARLIKEYERKLAAKPGTFSYAMILGHLHRHRGDIDAALRRYEEAAAAQPSDPRVHLARAELYRQRQRKEDAAKAYEQALPLARSVKEKKAILRALADLALDAGDVATARRHHEALVAADPSDPGARLELADALAKHGQHADALKEYQAAEKRLKTDPARRVGVLARIGAAHEALGNEDEAIAAYRRAMELTSRGHYLRKELTERIIDIYRKRQDLRALIAYYEKTWPARSRGHFEWDVLARLYEETGEQDKALAVYRKAVAAAPHELDTQRRLVALLERAGKDDEVLRQYEAIIRVAPGEPRFQLELAERWFKRGKKAKALAMLKTIAARFPDDAGVHGALADLYARWGEDTLALRAYQKLVRIEPNDPGHLVNLGEQHFQRGDKGKAVEIWKRIAASRTPESYARLAEVFAEHDMGSEAVDWYLKALALRPKDPGLYRGLAGVLERQRQDDRAVEAWQKVMALTAGDPAQRGLRREARTRIISILHRKSGQPLLAKTREWQRRFDAKPPDLDAGYFLAEAYLKLGRHEDAERALAALLRLDPKDVDAKHQLVGVLRSQRKYQEAIDLLKKLAAEHPSLERECYAQIAELELALYHDEAAIAYAQKALEKSPNDAQGQERLAEIYAKRGDAAKAIEAYRRAIELSPRNFKVHFALAKLYLRAGAHDDAARLYRTVIKRASDEETLRTAARKAIDLEEYLGTLGELEREIAPLAFLFAGKSTYRRVLVEIYDRYVPPLVARARSGDAAAGTELRRLGQHGLKPLLEALEDGGDPAQQRVAVRVLGYLGNKSAAPPLVKLAVDAPDSPTTPTLPTALGGGEAALDMDVRVEALVAAGRLGDPRVVPQLVGLLRHREVALREASAWALGRVRSPRAVQALVDALGDSRASVHALACAGLGRSGDRRALDRAAEVMRDPTRGLEARAACAYALGLARSGTHVPALVEVLGAGNDDVQVKAAWALGRIGEARSRGALLAAHFTKKEAVRDAIGWALGRIAAGGDPRPPPSEDVTLEAGKIDHRVLVRDLVPELAPERPLDPRQLLGHEAELAAGIADGLGRHRDLVVRVLRDLDARDDGLGLGPFTARLATASAGDRAAIGKLLARVATRVAPKVQSLTEHRDVEVRQLALRVLAKMGHPGAPPRIAAALADEALEVRLAALGAARRVLAGGVRGADVVATAAARRLAAPGWQERALAVDVLGHAPSLDPAPLVAALGDPSGFVREAAARALGHRRGGGVVTALLDATRDDVAEVRLAATKALVAVKDPRAQGRLAELAGADPDARVRRAAAGTAAP